MLSRSMIVLIGLASIVAGPAIAADMPGRTVAAAPADGQRTRKAVEVTVDRVFLRAGCPERQDCIAPRILPIPVMRLDNRVPILVEVDPRFASSY